MVDTPCRTTSVSADQQCPITSFQILFGASCGQRGPPPLSESSSYSQVFMVVLAIKSSSIKAPWIILDLERSSVLREGRTILLES